MQAVGAGSVNQAVKAIAIARRALDETLRMDVACYPEFIHIPAPNPSDGQRSALRWTLFTLGGGYERRRDGGRDDRGPRRDSRERPSKDQRDSRDGRDRPSTAATRAPPFRSETGDAKIQELKVAATSDAKAVAGAVILRLRTGDPVRITVMGPASINQMVKALAVARTYLEEDRADVAVYAQFIHLRGANDEEPERSALQITLYLTPKHKYGESDISEYKVASTTNPKSTAGAIANCVRAGNPCKLEALGPQAVGQAIKAIAIGRANLEGDNVDIFFVPEFKTMLLSNGRRSALELLVLPVKGP